MSGILNKQKDRFNEIDFLKGLAIITMITSHVFYFKYQMNMASLDFNSSWYVFLTLFAQIIFITCIGINLSLSYQNTIKIKEQKKLMENNNINFKDKYWVKQIKRVIIIGIFALILSFLTYLTHGYKFVKFGILHFASVAILIMMWSVKSNILNILIFIFILTLYYFKNNISSFLITSNIHPIVGFITGLGYSPYYSMDYFSLVPWISLISIGVLIGNIAYKKYKRRYPIPTTVTGFIDNNPFSKLVRTFGKYSFFIYLIHIPILFTILSIIKKMS